MRTYKNQLEESIVSRIIELFKQGNSVVKIAEIVGINRTRCSVVLNENGYTTVRIAKKPRNKFKDKMYLLPYHNMAYHIRFDVTAEWLYQFKDFKKLQTLNDMITNRNGRFSVDTEWYKKFILKFYDDKSFNQVYKTWCEHNGNKWLKPSIDHIVPVSAGGSKDDLNNFQILTWFENRCKNDMTSDEWKYVKENISLYIDFGRD